VQFNLKYDVIEKRVEILAIVPKEEAEHGLKKQENHL
jgi:hypothetical protein